jgi:hypothetical protein
VARWCVFRENRDKASGLSTGALHLPMDLQSIMKQMVPLALITSEDAMSSSPSDFDMSVSESAGGEVRRSRIRRVFLALRPASLFAAPNAITGDFPYDCEREVIAIIFGTAH